MKLLAVAVILMASVAHAETGLASFYSYSGHLTANGERYDGGEMTAAHRTLRFGTRVRVCRLNLARRLNDTKYPCVVVRINDRGPFVRGRVIDLSPAAAHRLGIIGRGVARVSVERVR